ncbi:patatin-like phospholipase family protein [Pseudomonas nitroreducens]|uniref:Patatin n=1 Tax=Pseudomonas nitroreducens TaxID=46680 RepID=A0A246F7V9_PSENT|nr:patatin-like phospholipase family protein [Pseudomonas nitroreducens]OWP49737.1 patatin [Pseudomonas nitroreducens]
MFWQKSPTHLLREKMDRAHTYSEWAEHAAALDRESGMDDWRNNEVSPLYDYRTVRQRYERLRGMRNAGAYANLMFALNEGIHGNLAGMGRAALYGQASLGTKYLIHQYIEEVCLALKTIDQLDESVISLEERKDFFLRAGQCFGRSALMLSGGAVLGYFHAGVLKALFEQDLLPSIISGSSAGSILASIACTHGDGELLQFLQPELLLMHSEAPGSRRRKRTRPVLQSDDLAAYLERLIPDLTFAEAYKVSGRHLNITVTGLEPRQAPRLLNAITAPTVLVRSAVMASCAIAGIYPPVTLQAKNAAGVQVPYLPEQQWIDGSFLDDLPAKRLGRLYGVNHFISSMANPAALLFTPNPNARPNLLQSAVNQQIKLSKGVATYLLRLGRDHLRIRNPTLARWQHLSYSVLVQDYIADINLFLGKRWHNPLKLLAPMPLNELRQLLREGEQVTWEHMEMVRNCTAISRTLDSILRARHWTV